MATMTQEPEDIKDMEAFLKMAKYPLVKHTDMPTDMREEAMDTCITAVEKYHADMEKCTQMIKETMDKKFGAPWHVVAGGYFSYDITFEAQQVFFCGRCDARFTVSRSMARQPSHCRLPEINAALSTLQSQQADANKALLP